MSNTEGTVGYSQRTPEDTNSDYNVMLFVARQLIARIATMMPCVVTAVQGGGGALGVAGTVSVQPLVTLLDGNGNAMPHGILASIPYFRYQGGSSAIILDPVVGDIGMVHFAMRDISNVIKNQAVANPGSYRQYDFADGIYVGGILNGTPTSYIRFDGQGNVTIAATNIILQGNLQLSGSIEAVGGGTYAGNIATTGTITAGKGGADQVGLQTHEHTGNNTPPTPGS